MFSLNRLSKSKELLSNLWQMACYFILKTNAFCMSVLCRYGRQLGDKYSERVNKGIQSPAHWKDSAVGPGCHREVVESGSWRACLSLAAALLRTGGRGLQTSCIAFKGILQNCTLLHICKLVPTMFSHTFNICTRWHFWWILNIDILK